MQVHQGSSTIHDAEAAVQEAAARFGTGPFEVLFAFCSTAQDPHRVASALEARFPGTPVVGCTTAGEHLNGVHSNGTLVLTALVDSGLQWATASVDDLGAFDADAAQRVATQLLGEVGTSVDDADGAECFCIAFVDGLRDAEESFTSTLADALGCMPLLGGSAGDDLAFVETRVFLGGVARTNAAVLLVGRGQQAFRVLKHQHFVRTATRLVVTRVDECGRRVLEMNGQPALAAYARALGTTPELLPSNALSLNPCTFSCDGQMYIRSVKVAHDDGSLTFACRVEEGMVLELGQHQDMAEALEADFAKMTAGHGRFQFLLGFNCAFRALESKQRGNAAALGALWRSAAVHSVGFDTYGEQLDGLHINQTLVAIALGLQGEGSEHV